MVFESNEFTEKRKIENLYFDKPTLVFYISKWSDKRKPGIAYCEEIIDVDEGTLFSMWDIKYIKILPWISFTEFIEEKENDYDLD